MKTKMTILWLSLAVCFICSPVLLHAEEAKSPAAATQSAISSAVKAEAPVAAPAE